MFAEGEGGRGGRLVVVRELRGAGREVFFGKVGRGFHGFGGFCLRKRKGMKWEVRRRFRRGD